MQINVHGNVSSNDEVQMQYFVSQLRDINLIKGTPWFGTIQLLLIGSRRVQNTELVGLPSELIRMVAQSLPIQ
jgi:hypothetical protein